MAATLRRNKVLNIPSIPLEEYKERVKKVQATMKKEGYDIILAYGNEAEPQFVRYFSDYWPSFETAGVLIPQKGDAMLLIGPESYTYAEIKNYRKYAKHKSGKNGTGHIEAGGAFL